ncbi:pimeloyl-ACP methyl ester carboxylesterase [Paraburkholderia sp. BL6669N2]|uniref:alpha/beta fold hydrolase n=1 Tax=Paraburkholderia sp. BL6669N2 TaxID=1938807 RepID=UPI000E246FE0|nr:alpha/beta hydrolase [Paraburkholderia sp. BL6669N2]REG49603.1 pimeloyl-ACP methyl ester carboxylesterase [Paraburkholderia sp. BL6669N2]
MNRRSPPALLKTSAITVCLLALLVLFGFGPSTEARAASPPTKPTIVLVHGAFADSSSWNGVASRLLAKGYPVVAVANPLRGVQSDAQYVAGVLASIAGPIILVGHSYGGNIITNVATGKDNVKALVYVSGLAPDSGESAATLSGQYPGSTLGPTLAPPVPLADGGKDLYIKQADFHAQFAADVPAAQAAQMAVAQRPITEAALKEPSGTPAWKSIPSYFIYGSRDKNIPPALQPFMADRAHAKKTVEILGASHVVMISHADAVAKIIEDAADAAGK